MVKGLSGMMELDISNGSPALVPREGADLPGAFALLPGEDDGLGMLSSSAPGSDGVSRNSRCVCSPSRPPGNKTFIAFRLEGTLKTDSTCCVLLPLSSLAQARAQGRVRAAGAAAAQAVCDRPAGAGRGAAAADKRGTRVWSSCCAMESCGVHCLTRPLVFCACQLEVHCTSGPGSAAVAFRELKSALTAEQQAQLRSWLVEAQGEDNVLTRYENGSAVPPPSNPAALAAAAASGLVASRTTGSAPIAIGGGATHWRGGGNGASPMESDEDATFPMSRSWDDCEVARSILNLNSPNGFHPVAMGANGMPPVTNLLSAAAAMPSSSGPPGGTSLFGTSPASGTSLLGGGSSSSSNREMPPPPPPNPPPS